MESNLSQQTNPLAKFMRQPKIYIKLPSQGKFWPAGSLALPDNGEVAVYSMTARDELMLKVPDALLNGQAVVEVVQNCVPAVKNGWDVPGIDLDALLIAIRIATYGEKMSTPVSLTVKDNDDIEFDYQVDLRSVLDTLMNQVSWDPVVPINETMTAYVRPIAYKQQTKLSVQTFETQKLIQIANDAGITEEEKIKSFTESFNKLTAITIDLVVNSVYRIDTPDGSVEDLDFIKEFIQNADKEVFNKLQNHLEKLRDQNSIKPIPVAVTDDLKAQGVVEDSIEVPLVFDPSTFFV